MKVSYGLPVHRVDRGAELCSGAAIVELAGAAEALGFHAVHLTEHPFPPADWVAHGGHHALDPLVGLAAVAGATRRIAVHAHLVVAPYRNPYLLAKAAATLDVASDGRLILGIGAGHLEGEFAALGASFADRGARTDDAIAAVRRAWTGEPVAESGPHHQVAGNVMLPRPVQRPGPPIWVGGSSARAARRAVGTGDGWAPFALPRRGRPASGLTPELADRIRSVVAQAAATGRERPFDVCFSPAALALGHPETPGPAEVVDLAGELAAVGVTWITAAFPSPTRAGQHAALAAWAEHVLPHLQPS